MRHRLQAGSPDRAHHPRRVSEAGPPPSSRHLEAKLGERGIGPGSSTPGRPTAPWQTTKRRSTGRCSRRQLPSQPQRRRSRPQAQPRPQSSARPQPCPRRRPARSSSIVPTATASSWRPAWAGSVASVRSAVWPFGSRRAASHRQLQPVLLRPVSAGRERRLPRSRPSSRRPSIRAARTTVPVVGRTSKHLIATTRRQSGSRPRSMTHGTICSPAL